MSVGSGYQLPSSVNCVCRWFEHHKKLSIKYPRLRSSSPIIRPTARHGFILGASDVHQAYSNFYTYPLNYVVDLWVQPLGLLILMRQTDRIIKDQIYFQMYRVM